jgi:hypothetical protein
MGERQNDALRVDFDRQIKLEFHGCTVTSDAGVLAHRELNNALGLTRTAASSLQDTRTGQNTQHTFAALLRQSICSRLASRTRPWTARSTLIWEIPVDRGTHPCGTVRSRP